MTKFLFTIGILLILQHQILVGAQLELTLKEPYNGVRFLAGEKVSLSKSEVIIRVEEQLVSIPREQVELIKFTGGPGAGDGESKAAGLNKDQNSPADLQEPKAGTLQGGDGVDPSDLNNPANRELFTRIQSEIMAKYAGRPGFDKAIEMQNSMFEDLASGRMSIEQLQAQAQTVSLEAKKYKPNETVEYPELPSLLEVLDNFSKQ